MYVCDVCGRKVKKKISYMGHILCSKHMHQLHKYGCILDTIQRTTKDLNDYSINWQENIARFNVYNQKNVYIGSFIIDADDIEKVKYHKWRFSHNQPMTGLPSRGTDRTVAQILLDFDVKNSNLVVDHINGNPYDNRKSNIRVVRQADNTKNTALCIRNTSGYKGVTFDRNRNCWCSEIRNECKRVHFKRQKDKRKAVYQRYVAEKLLFGKFARESELYRMKCYSQNLSQQTKRELTQHVIDKLKKHNLWQ